MIYEETLSKVLGRESSPLNNAQDLALLQRDRVLLTGANGSLGVEISMLLQKSLVSYLATDIETCDVTDPQRVASVVHEYRPTLIVHLAADKHAPQGELSPFKTFDINTNGTWNVIAAKNSLPKPQSCRVVLASTCKSCDPETAYGASKLISERLILNDGGNVARFYNVVETAGNVFQIWNELEPKAEIEVTPCSRYFISAAEATSLLIRVMALGVDKSSTNGRFSFNPGPITFMPDLAKELFPGRTLKLINPRRGDRLNEPLIAKSETITEVGERLWRVSSPHDAIQQFNSDQD